MKMADGGTRPGYNVEFATTTGSGVIVGVDVTNVGSDAGQMGPMLEQIEERFGQPPAEMLVDGGFATHADIEAAYRAEREGLCSDQGRREAEGQGHRPVPAEEEGRSWGSGVASAHGYGGSEDDLSGACRDGGMGQCPGANRGLYRLEVRGRHKVLAVALLYALVHNLLQAVALRRAQAEAAAR